MISTMLQLVFGKIKMDSTQWCKKYGIKEADILEYEGWNGKRWKDEITEMEFCQRVANSSLRECEGRDRAMVRMSVLVNGEKVRQEEVQLPSGYHNKATRRRHRKDGLSSKEITLRYLESLEGRNRRLERREYLWVTIICASIGISIGQYVGIIP